MQFPRESLDFNVLEAVEGKAGLEDLGSATLACVGVDSARATQVCRVCRAIWFETLSEFEDDFRAWFGLDFQPDETRKVSTEIDNLETWLGFGNLLGFDLLEDRDALMGRRLNDR